MNFELLNILEKVLGKSQKTTKENYAFFSPFVPHRKKKLQIDLNIKTDENGRPINNWHCWLSEKSGKSIYSLFNRSEVRQRVNGDILNALNEFFKNNKYNIFVRQKNIEYDEYKISLPTEYEFVLKTKKFEVNRVKNYLYSRGITNDDIIKYQIGFCDSGKYKGRVIIPSYNENLELNYFIARDYTGDAYLKYKNPPVSLDVIGLEYFIDWNEPIILVEGIFDAITIKRNVIPLFGKTLSEELKYKIYLNDVKKIILCLDNDAKKDSIKIIEYLLKNGIEVFYVNLEKKDPNEIGYEEIWKLIKTAIKIDFKMLVRLKMGM